MMSQDKSLIWVPTDVTMMMVTLTVLHECTAGPIASPIVPITMHTSKESNLSPPLAVYTPNQLN